MRALLFLALAACSPDINPGSYYCGPSEDCPPDLKCDGATDLCDLPATAGPFLCPAGTNANEPDNNMTTALDIGVAGCGTQSYSDSGCIDKASDIDYVTFTAAAGCNTIDVRLRAPVAWATPTVELMDDTSAVIATGSGSGTIDDMGETALQLTGTITGGLRYYVRVRLADGTPDCDGTCSYTWYQLSIL
jgi:hypothetical protein